MVSYAFSIHVLSTHLQRPGSRDVSQQAASGRHGHHRERADGQPSIGAARVPRGDAVHDVHELLHPRVDAQVLPSLDHKLARTKVGAVQGELLCELLAAEDQRLAPKADHLDSHLSLYRIQTNNSWMIDLNESHPPAHACACD